MSPYELTHQLVASIRASEEYKNYLDAKQKLKNDEEYYEIVKNFQKKQFEIKQAQFLKKDISPEQKEEYERLFRLLSSSSTCKEYLDAEFRVSRLISDIQRILGEVVQEIMPVGLEDLDLHV